MAAKSLTKSEKYLIYRRRHWYTQVEFAEGLDLSLADYRKIEGGHSMLDPDPAAIRRITLSSLNKVERCLIMRRRSKQTQQQIANDIGVSRNWLNQMEQGKVDVKTLADFWNL